MGVLFVPFRGLNLRNGTVWVVILKMTVARVVSVPFRGLQKRYDLKNVFVPVI